MVRETVRLRHEMIFIFSHSVQFSSVAQSCLTLCNPMNHSTPGLPVHHQLPESTQPMSIESVMPSNHLILCRPLFLLPSIFPSIRVFSNELALCIRWPEYWSFSFNISPSNESVQFSSVTQSCLTLCNPMNHSMPGLPVLHPLLESTQTHVHRVGDAIQPSHPLSSPSPPTLNFFQHQGLFSWFFTSGGQSIGASALA